VLSRSQICSPVSQILKYSARVYPGTPLIPAVPGDEMPLRGSRIISWLCHRFGVRSKPHRPVSYATFLLNTVPGSGLQIPFFIYPARRPLHKVVAGLDDVQERYGLSDIYLYQSDDCTTAVCLRTFPIRRLEKIISASGSVNYGTLVRYRQLFFRVGERKDERQQVLAGTPKYLQTLAAMDEGNCHYVSGPHAGFFAGYGAPIREYLQVHGRGSVVLAYTVIEE
jgi:hypothetical protein